MTSTVEGIGAYTGTQSLQWTNGYDPDNLKLDGFVQTTQTYRASNSTYEAITSQISHAGGHTESYYYPDGWLIYKIFLPESLLDVPVAGTSTIYRDWLALNPVHYFQEIIPGGHGGLHTGGLDHDEVRATTAYNEMTQTNGGTLAETKSFDPDSRNKALGLYNVESTKTLTYATDVNTGSIAQTSESITLDIMANSTLTSDVVACPFGTTSSFYYPAFCNVIYAKAESQGVTSAAMSSSVQVRNTAASADIPAELNFNFDVKPDSASDLGFAMGTFGTEFGVSIREARGNSLTPSALNVYTDKATVSGQVAKFTKNYAYKSGFRL